MSTDPTLENYFAAFAKDVIGNRQVFDSPFGQKEIIYADWTASGRAFLPIEDCIQKNVLPFVGNTHTATTITGTYMSNAYEQAKKIIKNHVHAATEDVLIFCGSGMTHAVNKLQRILGLRVPERMKDYMQQKKSCPPSEERLKPVVFVTHMEHHSNHTSWLETIATIIIINPSANGNVDLAHLGQLLEQYKDRKYKIAAVTACSNVTGIETPYHEIAKMLHGCGGWCFVDFACSAPYTAMNMHPQQKGAHLDAIYFSGHKFLGGPGTPGILVFNRELYTNCVPDQPGGGTVLYSNPWDNHSYVSNIEQREDGGTPPFLPAIKAAMCIRLKEAMGIDKIREREKEIVDLVFSRLETIKNCVLLEAGNKQRLPIFSIVVKDASHHLFVKLLNDRFGIQSRGGCSCAGTYGHYLLQVGKKKSYEILHALRKGDLSVKPGWIRISLHPIMSNATINAIMDAVELTAANYPVWSKDYSYDPDSDEYYYKGMPPNKQTPVDSWFTPLSPMRVEDHMQLFPAICHL